MGVHLNVSAKAQWQADDIFIDLLKDKPTINAVLEHIGGNNVAVANANATGKIQKSIIADHLRGTNGRKQIKEWIPNWLKFPFAGHTDTPIETTGIGLEWKQIASVFTDKKAEA